MNETNFGTVETAIGVVPQELLVLHTQDVSDQIGAIAVSLDTNCFTIAVVAITESAVRIRLVTIGVKWRMGSTQTRKPITEHRDVYRIAPVSIARVVLRVVSFQ